LKDLGLEYHFVQDNQAHSDFGVLRGLHFQKPPFTQAKLVRVLKGKIWDVVVDLRKDSATYKKSFSIEISAENFKQLLVPRGFAHGYLSLSKEVIFTYKCDNYYSKEHESGIYYKDAELAIDWHINEDETLVLSEKDEKLPLLKDLDNPF